MADQPSRFGAYRDLDASRELDSSVQWLDRVAALAAVREGKRRAYELLDLRPGDRILDVGCGTGVDIPALARLVSPGGEIVGVDSSQGVLAAAERVVAGAGLTDPAGVGGGVAARLEQADAAALPFGDGSFDACRCDRTVQHLPDPGAAIREMARVTRAGARVVISETRNQVAESEGNGGAVLGRILSLHQVRGERAEWVGFMLPWLLSQAGVIDVAIESVKGTLVEAEDIAGFYDLACLTERAVAAGHMAPQDAADLHQAVAREARAGSLTVVLETHIFYGRAT